MSEAVKEQAPVQAPVENKPADPRMEALSTLASICQEYVNVLGQTGKQVSGNLVIQAANSAIKLLQASIEEKK